MTILHPQAFNASPSANFDGVFDWDFLDGAFPRETIKPMDFDCVIEIHGSFLIFETKAIGKEIPGAQLRAFRSLPANAFTLVYLWGKNPPAFWRWERRYVNSGKECQPCDAQTIWDFAHLWGRLADARCGHRSMDDALRDAFA